MNNRMNKVKQKSARKMNELVRESVRSRPVVFQQFARSFITGLSSLDDEPRSAVSRGIHDQMEVSVARRRFFFHLFFSHFVFFDLSFILVLLFFVFFFLFFLFDPFSCSFFILYLSFIFLFYIFLLFFYSVVSLFFFYSSFLNSSIFHFIFRFIFFFIFLSFFL